LNEELSLKLKNIIGTKDEELCRIRSEKQQIHDDLVSSGCELGKMRHANEELQKDFDRRSENENQIRMQLAEKNGELTTLRLQRKSLQEQVGEVKDERLKIELINADLQKRNRELDRKKKQNNQLLESTKILEQECASEKFRAERKEQEYYDLQSKLLEFQHTLKGTSEKENALLEQLKELEKECQEIKRKYHLELQVDGELERENDNLKAKLAELQISLQKEDEELRAKLKDKVQLESKLSEENTSIKAELSLKQEECSRHEKSYIEIKTKYEEESSKKKITKVDFKKMEQESLEKIALLEKEEIEKDRRLAMSKQVQEQRTQELEVNEQSIALFGMELKKKDLELNELQNGLLALRQSDNECQQVITRKYTAEIETLEGVLKSWKMKFEENTQAEKCARSKMESQNKLMSSRGEMVQARNDKINSLKEATKTNATLDFNKNTEFGIQMTSVIDSSNDFKSGCQMQRVEMGSDCTKKRKMHNRRPSIS